MLDYNNVYVLFLFIYSLSGTYPGQGRSGIRPSKAVFLNPCFRCPPLTTHLIQMIIKLCRDLITSHSFKSCAGIGI